jgi:Phosphoribosyltransferase
VLARDLDAELIIADIGLRGPKVAGVRDLRVAEGTTDLCAGSAMTRAEARRAINAGFAPGTELAARCELVVLGEIGIGNTTVALALLAALTGLLAKGVCGRGTGLDSQGVERKQLRSQPHSRPTRFRVTIRSAVLRRSAGWSSPGSWAPCTASPRGGGWLCSTGSRPESRARGVSPRAWRFAAT